MKKFLQIDFYLQISVLIGTLLVLIIVSIIEKSWAKMFFFYWIVGGVQLLSFLIKYFTPYKKSILFKIYSFTILPIWISLMFIPLLGNSNFLGGIALLFLIFGLYSSPISALLYVIDCFQTYKNYEKSNL